MMSTFDNFLTFVSTEATEVVNHLQKFAMELSKVPIRQD